MPSVNFSWCCLLPIMHQAQRSQQILVSLDACFLFVANAHSKTLAQEHDWRRFFVVWEKQRLEVCIDEIIITTWVCGANVRNSSRCMRFAWIKINVQNNPIIVIVLFGKPEMQNI